MNGSNVMTCSPYLTTLHCNLQVNGSRIQFGSKSGSAVCALTDGATLWMGSNALISPNLGAYDMGVALYWSNVPKLVTSADGIIVSNMVRTATVSTDALIVCNDAHTFGNAHIDGDVSVSSGGSVVLMGPSLRVDGDVTARSNITVSKTLTASNVTVRSNLSVSGTTYTSNLVASVASIMGPSGGGGANGSLLCVEPSFGVASNVKLHIGSATDRMYLNFINGISNGSFDLRLNSNPQVTFGSTNAVVHRPAIFCNTSWFTSNVSFSNSVNVTPSLGVTIDAVNGYVLNKPSSTGSVNVRGSNFNGRAGYSINDAVGFISDPSGGYGLYYSTSNRWSVRSDLTRTELYHSSNLRLATTSNGIQVTGKIVGSDWISSALNEASANVTDVAASIGAVSQVYGMGRYASNILALGTGVPVLSATDRLVVPRIAFSNQLAISGVASLASSNGLFVDTSGGLTVVGAVGGVGSASCVMRLAARPSSYLIPANTGTVDLGVAQDTRPYVGAGSTVNNLVRDLYFRTSNTERVRISGTSGDLTVMCNAAIFANRYRREDGTTDRVVLDALESRYTSGSNHRFYVAGGGAEAVRLSQDCNISMFPLAVQYSAASPLANYSTPIRAYNSALPVNSFLNLSWGRSGASNDAANMRYVKRTTGVSELQFGFVDDNNRLAILSDNTIAAPTSKVMVSQLQASAATGVKLRQNNYAALLVNDNQNMMLLSTNQGDPDGASNAYRPLRYDMRNGHLFLHSNVLIQPSGATTFSSDVAVTGALTANGLVGALSKDTVTLTTDGWYRTSGDVVNRLRFDTNGPSYVGGATSVILRGGTSSDSVYAAGTYMYAQRFVGAFQGDASLATALNAANMTSGTLNADRVPVLNADKITTGYMAGGRMILGNMEQGYDSLRLKRFTEIMAANPNFGVGLYVQHTIQTDGNVEAQNFINISDGRRKTNVRDIGGAAAMDVLNKLKPKLYTKKSRNPHGVEYEKEEAGFIAQEVYYEVEELAHTVSLPRGKTAADFDRSKYAEEKEQEYGGWGDHLAALYYTEYIPYMIGALQEKDREISDLKRSVQQMSVALRALQAGR